MFNPIGQVTLLITNEKTGESRKIVEFNTFTEQGYQAALNLGYTTNILQYSPFSSPSRLYISSSTATPDRYVTTVGGLIAQCESPAGVPPTSWTEATEDTPMYGELRGRLPFTGASRAFRTVVVGESLSANSIGSTVTSTPAYAYVRFDSDVIQAPFETIDIFYRVYFVNNVGLGLPRGGDLIRHIGRVLFGFELQFISSSNNERSPIQAPSLTFLPDPDKYNYFITNRDLNISGTVNGAKGLSVNRNISRLFSHLEFKLGGNSQELDAFTGRVINSLSVGSLSIEDIAATVVQLVPPSRNPIQTSWGKRFNAPSPFYDASWSANGSGRIIPSGTWTNYYPDMFIIRIVNSGNVGVATYRLERVRFTHFNGNSWNQIGDVIPFLGHCCPRLPFSHSHGHQNHINYKVLNDRTLVRWDSTGVTIIDVLNGEYKNFDTLNDLTVTGANLPVTNIKQIEIFNGFIYVACSNTGLWRINPSGGTNSVVNIINAPVYAVSSAFNNTSLDLFIITLNGITNLSSNWNTFFNPSNSNITNYGWQNAFALVGCKSPNRPNGEFIIHFRNGTNAVFVWWSVSIGNSSTNSLSYDTPPNGSISPLEKASMVSTFGDYWIFYHNNSSFVANSFNGVANGNNNVGASNINGVPNLGFFDEKNYFYPSFFNNTAFSFREGNIITVGATNLRSFSNNALPSTMLYLGRNLYFNEGSIGLCSYEPETWGWNGTSWVLNHSGAKQTHSNSQSLLDGISVSFENGTVGTSFQSQDFYTIPLCNGVLGDNARYIEHYVTFSATEIVGGSI